MKTLYFDCYSGVSGDMILGAMLDLGVKVDELKAALESLPVGGYHFHVKPVSRCGIGATQAQVHLDHDAAGMALGHSHGHDHSHSHSHDDGHTHEHGHSHDHEHSHSHEDGHTHEHPHVHKDDEKKRDASSTSSDLSHTHDHGHAHSHEHSHSHGHQHHRGFSEIKGIIEASKLPARVKLRAVEAFRRIAVEEAAVHQTTIEEVHFHEVGAVDAIVDIVGAMWCFDKLGIERFEASPLAVGRGTVIAAHGEMPVPAPATARLLRGIPITTGTVDGELTTPTGAAILATVVQRFGDLNQLQIDKIGYGAGTREYSNYTNYLRVYLGENQAAPVAQSLNTEQITVIETEIDDMTPEALGFAQERLFAAGAVDVSFQSIQMKKNRPGHSLRILCMEAKRDAVIEVLFRNTSTFGCRVSQVERLALRRKIGHIKTPLGTVHVKTGYWGDEVLRQVPEYEDCRRLAEANQLPISDVFEMARAAISESKHS